MIYERMRAYLIGFCALVGGACGAAHDREHAEADPHAEHHEQGEHAHVEARSADARLRVDKSMLRDLRITTSAAELRPAGDTVTALGELQVDEERYAEVGAPIAARVSRVLAGVGDAVAQGQLLVELESPEVGRARAAALAARAEADLLRRVAGRREQLARDRIVAQRELDSAQAELSAAEAQLQAAEQQLAALGGARGHGTQFGLVSPLAGTVIERNVLRGRRVSGEETLFVVGDLTRLWLVAHAFERDALRIHSGGIARASFPALPGQEFTGPVTRIGSRVDPSSRTIDIRIELDNTAGLLRPGMSATAHIPVGAASDRVVTVPVAAVQRLPEGWCVFLPTQEDGVFERRAVGRGRDLGGEVEILQGVRQGERVVVDGAFLLKAEADKARGTGAEHHHH